MKSYWTLLFFIITCCSFSQKHAFDFQKTYSVQQILEDIDYTERYLTKFHPNPYQYIRQDSLHQFVANLKTKIDSPLTELQVRFLIKQIVAKIGCGHTDVGGSKQYTKAIKNTSRLVLPLNVVLTDSSQLVILNNLSSDSTIKAGDEIVGMDGFSTKQIIKTIYAILTSDGYNETYKRQVIQNDWFKYYYSFCFGFKSQYSLTIKHQDNHLSEHQLEAISSLKDTLILPKKDSVTCIRKIKTCSYSILKTDTQMAVIDIDGFRGKHWRPFFRRTFQDLKYRHIKHLVIDVRDNGGGKIYDGLYMLSYLINQKLILSFDRNPDGIFFNPKFKMSIGSRVAPFAFSTLMPWWPKNGRLRHYFVVLPKKRYQFEGHIYVLMNGKTFSMSAISATYLKYKANAMTIGEETGGSVSGSNAVISGRIVLPNSKLQVYIPIYHIYHDIDIKENGQGLLPDHSTYYSKQDILKGLDKDLLKVKELVKTTN